jgi:hypothetical protein
LLLGPLPLKPFMTTLFYPLSPVACKSRIWFPIPLTPSDQGLATFHSPVLVEWSSKHRLHGSLDHPCLPSLYTTTDTCWSCHCLLRSLVMTFHIHQSNSPFPKWLPRPQHIVCASLVLTSLLPSSSLYSNPHRYTSFGFFPWETLPPDVARSIHSHACFRSSQTQLAFSH